MKLQALLVLILASLTLVEQKKPCTKEWGVSSNYSIKEHILQDKSACNNELSLAVSVFIEKDSLDFMLNNSETTNVHGSFQIQGVILQKSAMKKIYFQHHFISIYQIFWTKDDTKYNDFSSFFIYTREYGIIYKLFRKNGKEFFRWRLVNIKYADHELPVMNLFTHSLLKDTLFFEKLQLSN